MRYNEIYGDLIELAKAGKFDAIVHGCNCFCRMKRGIAPKIAKAFGCDKFPLEHKSFEGTIKKLGQIDYQFITVVDQKVLGVINAYTQFHWDTGLKPLDYEALILCLRKINYIFKGQHIGLPTIGCGLAGGNWDRVKNIIKRELSDCNVTVVLYKI